MPGFSFRATAAYTTDGAGISPVTDPDLTDFTYPYTSFSNGVTAGWVGGPGNMRARDRDNSVDSRLVGMHFNSGATEQATFRVDLSSSGSKTINLACGSSTDATTDDYIELFDNTSSLGTLVNKTSGHSTGHFIDATNVDRANAATWVSSNAAATKTFTSTIFKLLIGRGASSAGNPMIGHFFYADAGGGGGGGGFACFKALLGVGK